MDPLWLQPMLDKYIKARTGFATWIGAKTWQGIDAIPGQRIWWLRSRLKGLLIADINERAAKNGNRTRSRRARIAFGALL